MKYRKRLKSIFIEGTAGSGKSLLTARLSEYYTKNGAFAAILNLDPGVEDLPYSCDIDVRDFVDMVSMMKQYNLGPNGALIMANDLLASKIDEIQEQIDNVNPDYLLIDTPGQIELFAYRSSGPFLAQNLVSDQKASIFLYDGALINAPVNFVSIALLATSIRLRLGLATVNVLTKTDIVGDRLREILRWSNSLASLEEAIAKSTDGETYSLIINILRGLNLGGFAQGLIPISNITGEGMQNLEASLSRIINLGEEIED